MRRKRKKKDRRGWDSNSRGSSPLAIDHLVWVRSIFFWRLNYRSVTQPPTFDRVTSMWIIDGIRIWRSASFRISAVTAWTYLWWEMLGSNYLASNEMEWSRKWMRFWQLIASTSKTVHIDGDPGVIFIGLPCSLELESQISFPLARTEDHRGTSAERDECSFSNFKFIASTSHRQEEHSECETSIKAGQSNSNAMVVLAKEHNRAHHNGVNKWPRHCVSNNAA